MCRLPISALQHNIVAEFEKVAKANEVDLRRAVDRRKMSAEIDLRLDKVPPRGPYADLCARKVVMYESHLAFLWAYMYSSFVIYEECVQRPMLEKVFDGAIHYTQPLTIRARSLQLWAFAFSRQYSDWDEELLPNPKVQANDAERSYCLKVNGVYLTSVAFLLFHEYAHLTLGHQATNDESWSLAQEVDADNFALSCIADASLSEERRLVAGLSIVLLCASNFFLPKDIRGVWQASHPHLHDRLRNGLSALNLHYEKSQSYLYYLAAISLQQYLQDRGVETLEPVERETASDLFYEYLETIDKLRPTKNQMSAS